MIHDSLAPRWRMFCSGRDEPSGSFQALPRLGGSPGRSRTCGIHSGSRNHVLESVGCLLVVIAGERTGAGGVGRPSAGRLGTWHVARIDQLSRLGAGASPDVLQRLDLLGGQA